jgi:hypothetical protein
VENPTSQGFFSCSQVHTHPADTLAFPMSIGQQVLSWIREISFDVLLHGGISIHNANIYFKNVKSGLSEWFKW